jgi:hypothetical protein
MVITSRQLSTLWNRLTTPGIAKLTLPDGTTAVLNSIEREDGSGRSFNLYLTVAGQRRSLYVRVQD